MHNNKRPTIARIAEQAKLSVATVDRVLNARAPVNPHTSQKVYEAAEALGYYAARLMSQRIAKHKPGFRLSFLLMAHDSPFYTQLQQGIETAARACIEANVLCHFARQRDRSPEAIAGQIGELAAQCDCLAVVSYEHPLISQAMASARSAGVVVVSVLSENATPGLSPYVGSDNAACGRTAGWLLSHLIGPRPARVATLLGGHRFVGHEARDRALREYLHRHAPHLQVLAPIINLDNPAMAEEATFELLARHEGLGGVYITGGGSEGLVRALRQLPERPAIHVITHELTAVHAQALADGLLSVVFDSDTQALGQALVKRMMGLATPGHQDDGRAWHVPFRLVTPENLQQVTCWR